MRCPLIVRFALPVSLGLLLAGCGQEFYSARTVVHSDGTVDRAILQPLRETPEAALPPDAWQRSRRIAKPKEPVNWDGTVEQFPRAAEDAKPEATYFVASSRRLSAEAIPKHYELVSTDKTRSSTLERDYTRNDWGLVTEHLWRETLTDIVSFPDARLARRELATLLIDLEADTLTELLGPEYDTSPLIDRLRTEGLEWFEEFVDVGYEVASQPNLGNREELFRRRIDETLGKRWRAVAKPYGLGDINPLDKDLPPETQDRLEQSLLAELTKLMRRKDGQPVERSVLEQVLDSFSLTAQVPEEQVPIEQARQRVIDRNYGGKEQLEARLGSLFQRVVGVYWPFGGTKSFEYTLQLPGLIVETNGTLHADGKAAWRFKGSEAFPLGYSMTARALESNTAALKQLTGTEPLGDREKLLRYLELVKPNESLAAALRASVEQGTLKPLRDHVATLRKNGDEESLQRVSQLAELLGIDVPTR